MRTDFDSTRRDAFWATVNKILLGTVGGLALVTGFAAYQKFNRETPQVQHASAVAPPIEIDLPDTRGDYRRLIIPVEPGNERFSGAQYNPYIRVTPEGEVMQKRDSSQFIVRTPGRGGKSYTVNFGLESKLHFREKTSQVIMPGEGIFLKGRNGSQRLFGYAAHDPTGKVVFWDVKTAIEVPYNAQGKGVLRAMGQDFKVLVDPRTGAIAVDQDGDGKFTGSLLARIKDTGKGPYRLQ